MLVSVVVLPQPPLLVPELAGGAADETAGLRTACVTAAGRLAAAAPSWIAIGADAGGRRTVEGSARGTFAGFGVDVRVSLDTGAAPGESAPPPLGDPDPAAPGAAPVDPDLPPLGDPDPAAPGAAPVDPDLPLSLLDEGWAAGGAAPADPDLPLPLLIAGWAAGRTGRAVRITGELVAPDADPADCLALGKEIAAACAGPEPVGLLVVGDGSAMHAERGPGQLDPRAAPFDDAVAAALAAPDPAALAALDPALADELWVAGRAPWQVLAGCLRETSVDWSADLLYSAAPYGVAYHVAVWTPAVTGAP